MNTQNWNHLKTHPKYLKHPSKSNKNPQVSCPVCQVYEKKMLQDYQAPLTRSATRLKKIRVPGNSQACKCKQCGTSDDQTIYSKYVYNCMIYTYMTWHDLTRPDTTRQYCTYFTCFTYFTYITLHTLHILYTLHVWNTNLFPCMHTLHYVTLHYVTLHYVTLHYVTLHYVTLHYVTLRYVRKHTWHTYHNIKKHLITQSSIT